MNEQTSYDCLPYISDFDVYMKIRKAKKLNSSVGCDIPVEIIKNFMPEISGPVSKIFNLITKTQNFPKHWKIENGIAIKKIPAPESESNLRIISKTPFLSKLYEAYIFDWLIEIISPYLDPDQFGV